VRDSELNRKAGINGFARKIARKNEDVRKEEQMRGTGAENSRNTQSGHYKYFGQVLCQETETKIVTVVAVLLIMAVVVLLLLKCRVLFSK
jgi:hypothetical protein